MTRLDRQAHPSHRVLAQQLQNLDEPARAGRDAVVGFQPGAELGEARRQLPVAEDRRVLQRAWLSAQGRQVVDRFEDHGRFGEAPLV